MTVQHQPEPPNHRAGFPEDAGADTSHRSPATPAPDAGDGVVARVPGTAPRDAGRSSQVVTWIGWHLGELAAVGVPAVLAVSVHPLWAVPAAVVAGTWAAHEVRAARRNHRQVRSRGPVERVVERHDRVDGVDGINEGGAL